MRVVWRKEEGQFGLSAILLIIFGILAFFLVIAMNRALVNMAWGGFVEEMKPDHLFPHLLSNGVPNAKIMGGHGGKSLLYGALWLQQNIVLRYVVNVLFIIILLFIGVAYLYYDIFEQYLNTRLKTFIPRIVFGLILAYGGVYIVEALMYLAHGAYILFYNLNSPFNDWQNPDFMVSLNLPPIHASGPLGGFEWALKMIIRGYINFIWVFIAAVECLTLLVLIAARDYLLAVLLVLLPVASLLLIHPWTQRLGSRLWWLTIDLVFLPVIMIIPLSLMGLVHNSVSFTIAGLTITIGAIYLIAQEPLVLTGAGFTRGGSVLMGGITGGALGGSVIAPSGIGRMAAQTGTRSFGGAYQMLKQALKTTKMSVGGGAGAGGMGGAMNNMISKLKGKR